MKTSKEQIINPAIIARWRKNNCRNPDLNDELKLTTFTFQWRLIFFIVTDAEYIMQANKEVLITQSLRVYTSEWGEGWALGHSDISDWI